MAHERASTASVVHSGFLFVFGGYNQMANAINAVECYDRTTNQWRHLAPMRHARTGASACALKEFIYVCGGGQIGPALGAIERYDSQKNEWIEVNYFVYCWKKFMVVFEFL